MKRKLFLIATLFLFVTGITQAQETRPELYSVAFYNLENLFDTIHDPGKNDHDFLPEGSMKWTSEKYEAKLKNMAQVLSELSRDKTPQGPAVIGVAEIENLRVLEDLVKEPAIADERYGIVHYEGPDHRGIDCALLFNPRQFTVYSSRLVLSEPFEGDTVHKTRGFLVVNGNLAGDRVCFIVNHWPSRGAEAPVRIHAGNQVRVLTDSLLRMDKDLKIIIMGDMNDDPMDESMTVALGAKKYVKQVKKRGDLYNPFWEILEDKGVGTLLYRGKWNLFDQIVVSRSLFKPRQGELVYDHAEVFIRDYLIQQDGRYKGSPLRTHGGKEWLNGYSDHLPTILYLRRK